MSNELKKIDQVADVPIYDVVGSVPSSFIYKAGLMINADGAPTAYGPAGSDPLDFLANAGSWGNWWGIATNAKGVPYLQEDYHPAPGYYVSTTALVNPQFPETNPNRYLDSSEIPFFVLPGKHPNGASLGDVALLYNIETGDNMFCCYGDIGPADKIGEASICAARCLKINTDPKTGGTSKKIVVTLVFPKSSQGWKPPDVWFTTASKLFTAWGGITKLEALLPQL
jgi:Fungal chitosanase of glycosyl hydrolase group 75